ncbi:MAG: ATP-binding protein [Pyrinomonadaceae bacterium]
MPAFIAKWFHEPTNDDRFVGREEEIELLDHWVHDDAVRAVGVSAVGGTGKTALIGHWLKDTQGWRTRPFEGLFAWSFYQDRDAASFLRELLLWAHAGPGASPPDAGTDLVEAALAYARAHPIVVLLDGLEVLQGGPGDAHHGTFLDGLMREFLGAFCQRTHRGLAVLTSRFVFADLERFLGTSFKLLELSGLPPEQGATLLGDLGVGGPASEREHISKRLDGHPLGLRVFADALPDGDREQPRRFLNHAFRPDELPENSLLNERLRRLLTFYEKQLRPFETRLLGIVALFRTPVADETVLRLARGLFGEALPDDGELAAGLKRLQARGILSREPLAGGYGSACHPILRDHFRAVLLGAGADTARRAADLLKGQPSGEAPRSVKEIEPVLLAISLLLDVGDFAAADGLYRSRLDDVGGGEVFQSLPAAGEGLACALGFVGDEARRRQCEEKLSRRGLRFYLNRAGHYGMLSGYCEPALNFYRESKAVSRDEQDGAGLSAGLLNEAVLLVALGRLAEARRAIAESFLLAASGRGRREVRDGYVCLGWVDALRGRVRPAAESFAVANEIEGTADPGEHELYSGRGVLWADLLVRTGHAALASRRTQSNLLICERYRWNDDIGRCRWVLGRCALAGGRPDAAAAEFELAEGIFYGGQLIYDLARLHVAAGELDLARGNAAGALGRAAEALAHAAPGGMKVVQADALVLRGRARMSERADEKGAARALDDAEEALRLARECEYAWGERDGLSLKATAHAALAARHQAAGGVTGAERELSAARRASAEAESLAAGLVLSEEDLAAAGARAASWMREWG